MKRKTLNNEVIIGFLVLIIIAVCACLSPQFRTVGTLFNLIRAILISGIMAIPCLLVFIIGGLDLSFMAVAAFSSYTTVTIFTKVNANPPIIVLFLVGIVFGMLWGLVNAFFVIVTRLPVFVVTIATQFIIKGSILAFVGKSFLQVPQCMVGLSKTMLLTVTDTSGGQIGINISILILVALYVVVGLILKYSRLGRMLYAIGGDQEAARRVGINVDRTITLVFVLVGAIAAIGGVLNASLLRLSIPEDMIGGELLVIAAVVLGGADSSKGKGTVVGTLFGVILITIISNTLNLLKIPTYWQEAVIGIVMILGTIFSMSMNRPKTASKKLKVRSNTQ